MLSLVYVSSATSRLTIQDLIELLERSRPRNRDREITGTLLYSGGNIIQVLEGPDSSVEATFAEIDRDPRHKGVTVIWREPLERRAFPDWSMGFRELSGTDVDVLEGFSDFMRTGSTADVDRASDPTIRLLHAFRDTMR